MSEQLPTAPNRLKKFIVKSTAIAATGAGALNLVGCTVSDGSSPTRDFGNPHEDISVLCLSDGTNVRSEPFVPHSDEPADLLFTVNEAQTPSNFKEGFCVPVEGQVFGHSDYNGTSWLSMPREKVASIVPDTTIQKALSGDSDGKVWVQTGPNVTPWYVGKYPTSEKDS